MNTLGNRRHSIIDGLEPDIKETVDEMSGNLDSIKSLYNEFLKTDSKPQPSSS